MPDSRAEFERELKLSDAEKATGALRRIVADFDEIDRELRAAEKRAGLEVAPDIPLVDRMARLGYSERSRTAVGEMIAALNDIRRQRALSEQAQAILANREAAMRSADQQLAAILVARQKARRLRG